MGRPSVFPTGTTIYDPQRAWSGYTVYQTGAGVLVIDMNGREVKLWEGLDSFPPKLLRGGAVIGAELEQAAGGGGAPRYKALVQVDWDGRVQWRQEIAFHHDFQRAGSSTGYYAPGAEMQPRGNTLILSYVMHRVPRLSDKMLMDDRIVELTPEGETVWEWLASDALEEMGFDEAARMCMYRDPNLLQGEEPVGDWLHINSVSTLGPNRWYDAGDMRFHPDNIIWDGREASVMGILDRQSKKLVWRLGPDFVSDPRLRAIGPIVGQHHVHMIPRGLPGEGNLLLFDNGGVSGYGAPNPGAPSGRPIYRRDYSRVLELDPITLEIRWQYMADPLSAYAFYSPYMSAAQRLPNGNTLITEACDGRLFEVTPAGETVWEYIHPYWGNLGKGIYRAYRYPYEWLPQLDRPAEIPVVRLDNDAFRVPGAAPGGCANRTKVCKQV